MHTVDNTTDSKNQKLNKEENEPFLSVADSNETVVVGGGITGMVTAIECAKKGHKVLVLEENEYLGGNLIKLIDGINVVGSELQEKEGIKDSVELFKKDILRSGEGLCNEQLVDILARRSKEAYNFMKEMGVEFDSLHQLGGHSLKRTLLVKDCNQILTKITDKFHDFIEEEKISIITGCKAVNLIPNNNGTDIVFETDNQGMIEPLIECNSIILATGGFHGNLELFQMVQPDNLNITKYAMGSNLGTASINKTLRQLGAKASLLKTIQFCSTTSYEAPNEKDEKLSDFHIVHEMLREFGAILIDNEGKRFVNELATQNQVSKAIVDRCSVNGRNSEFPIAQLIINEEIMSKMNEESNKNYFVELSNNFERFENFSQYCSSFNLNEDILQETISQYNYHVGKNPTTDFSGRKHFAFPFKWKQPIYRIKVTPAINTTLGGFVIDQYCQPIWNGNIRRNIFCVGSISTGIHGKNILAGNSLLESIVFGRIAANSAINGVPIKSNKTSDK